MNINTVIQQYFLNRANALLGFNAFRAGWESAVEYMSHYLGFDDPVDGISGYPVPEFVIENKKTQPQLMEEFQGLINYLKDLPTQEAINEIRDFKDALDIVMWYHIENALIQKPLKQQ